MPASTRRTFGSSEPEREHVALLSYLPLKSYWRNPVFFFYTAQVVKQLASAEGVLGYSVLARPLSKQFWTLSAWKDDAALRTFVQYPHHVRIMTALAPHVGETKRFFAEPAIVVRTGTAIRPPFRFAAACTLLGLSRRSREIPRSSHSSVFGLKKSPQRNLLLNSPFRPSRLRLCSCSRKEASSHYEN